MQNYCGLTLKFVFNSTTTTCEEPSIFKYTFSSILTEQSFLLKKLLKN